MKQHETSRQFIDLSAVAFTGRVLDIGGGGEGMISRHSDSQVTAIDCRVDELEEAPDFGLKVVMDACNLQFLDNYFDNITCFYSLMYMTEHQIEQFLSEAARVAKPGAKLWIWDAVIPPVSDLDVFIAQLEVKVSDKETISTGYGVSATREQSSELIRELCEKAGFVYLSGNENEEAFFMCLKAV